MAKIWGILRKNHKIYKDLVFETEGTDLEDTKEAVGDICKSMDIPQPIWLHKQEEELELFGRTRFNQDNFIESIDFDHFEIEYLKEKRKSSDPRNDFSF
ncbi:MAG: hypothetical protein II781_03160 [Clostridia bacterium]|nr:hypothetical protein [Clostridia bacterium]